MFDETCLGFKNYSTAMVVLLIENEFAVASLVRVDLEGFKADTQGFMTPIINLNKKFFSDTFDIDEVDWDEVREHLAVD